MYDNKIAYRLTGRYACFSDPPLRVGGEKSSLAVPTYQALKGITESCYWKPSIIWRVDRVKILNPILTETKGVRPIKYGGGNDLSYYTYLKNVDYLVEVHFEFNQNRMDLKEDWNENKHYSIAKRALSKGGRRDIFLGTRECQGYITPEEFDSVDGYYNGIMDFGFQYHSIVYSDESSDGLRHIKFWKPKMIDSVIDFCSPDECPVDRVLPANAIKTFNFDVDMQCVDDVVMEG